MLDSILNKLGFSTVQDFLDNEKKFIETNKGIEADRPNPFLKLTKEERHFFQEYVNSNNFI